MRKNSLIAIALLLFTCLIFTDASYAGGQKPKIMVRFHTEIGGSGSSKGNAIPLNLVNPSQQIWVNRLPEVSENDLAAVTQLPDGTTLIQLNTNGTRALEAATSTKQGKILVIIVNGRVVYAPQVDMVLRDGRVIVPGGITKEEVETMKRYIEFRRKG